MSDHPHTPNKVDTADRRVVAGGMTWRYDEAHGWFNDDDDPAMWTEADMLGEIERLSAVVAAVDAWHQPRPGYFNSQCCRGCDHLWPCDTHLAIHPKDNR